MAVAPTGAIYKSLIFDGEDSRDYGVYITGEAVFNAPEREVEMITIPARNGAFAMDQGRFENIEVTYPAGIFADTEADFAQAISDFRNALCSKRGYCRLTDDYNPAEYRMAIYKSGLEVSPAQLKAGEFDITFECKPQRFLTSGETAITVTSGDTITNPTLFESSPMIEVKGKGSLNINGKTMLFQNDTLGVMEIVAGKKWNWLTTAHLIVRTPEKALYNTGDTLTLLDTVYGFSLHSTAHDAAHRISNAVVTDNNNRFTTSFITTDAAGYAYFRTAINSLTFTAGTDSTITDTITITATMGNGSSQAFSVLLNVSYDAEGTYGQSYFDLELNSTLPSTYYERQESGGCPGITANSTISILNITRYVDCEIGEVYLFYNGTMFSLNKYTDLGSDLPVLKPGNNSITYSNTFTEVKIIPKWWKL